MFSSVSIFQKEKRKISRRIAIGKVLCEQHFLITTNDNWQKCTSYPIYISFFMCGYKEFIAYQEKFEKIAKYGHFHKIIGIDKSGHFHKDDNNELFLSIEFLWLFQRQYFQLKIGIFQGLMAYNNMSQRPKVLEKASTLLRHEF